LDMSKGSILKNIILFALPLIAGNLLQLLYNASDIIVVSRWAGSNAMASVGSTGSLNALIVNACIGLSIGASVIVSKRYGAGDTDGIHRAVHTAMLLSVIIGIIALIAGEAASKYLLTLMGTPAGEVLEGAVLYMRLYFVGVPASLVYNFGAAILRAVGDTRRPLYILAASGLVNVVFNLIFVIVFHMGVAGVAIATSIANYISALAVVYTLANTDGAYRLIFSQLKFHKDELKETLTIGLPSGLQSSLFSLSNTVIQSAVNSFGTAAIAGSAAGSNIEGFVYTAMNSFHQATITSVSQNYGAKNEKRVYKSIIIPILCATVVGVVLGALTVIFANPLLSIYITDSPEAIKFGIVRMMYTGLPYFLCGIMDVMTGALRGLGYSGISALNSLIGACGTRMLWVFFVLPLNRTMEMLFLCWPLSWFIVIIMHTVCFFIVRKKAMAQIYCE
ncbi:MAG: MATE family efflux transporter, partial [Clostridia bacterium]|nr:MATE family efflux transporter [Clostridia bacterium]